MKGTSSHYTHAMCIKRLNYFLIEFLLSPRKKRETENKQASERTNERDFSIKHA